MFPKRQAGSLPHEKWQGNGLHFDKWQAGSLHYGMRICYHSHIMPLIGLSFTIEILTVSTNGRASKLILPRVVGLITMSHTTVV